MDYVLFLVLAILLVFAGVHVYWLGFIDGIRYTLATACKSLESRFGYDRPTSLEFLHLLFSHLKKGDKHV